MRVAIDGREAFGGPTAIWEWHHSDANRSHSYWTTHEGDRLSPMSVPSYVGYIHAEGVTLVEGFMDDKHPERIGLVRDVFGEQLRASAELARKEIFPEPFPTQTTTSTHLHEQRKLESKMKEVQEFLDAARKVRERNRVVELGKQRVVSAADAEIARLKREIEEQNQKMQRIANDLRSQLLKDSMAAGVAGSQSQPDRCPICKAELSKVANCPCGIGQMGQTAAPTPVPTPIAKEPTTAREKADAAVGRAITRPGRSGMPTNILGGFFPS